MTPTTKRTGRTHVVKHWPKYHRSVVSGETTSQLRKDDRDYQIGDEMLMREYNSELDIYTGSTCRVLITDALRGIEGLMPGYCLLSTFIGPDATRHNPSIAGKSAREIEDAEKNNPRVSEQGKSV